MSGNAIHQYTVNSIVKHPVDIQNTIEIYF